MGCDTWGGEWVGERKGAHLPEPFAPSSSEGERRDAHGRARCADRGARRGARRGSARGGGASTSAPEQRERARYERGALCADYARKRLGAHL